MSPQALKPTSSRLVRMSSPTQEELRAYKEEHKLERFELDELRDFIGNCRRCVLCETREHIVFGSGPHDARVLIIGEAPGAKEDREGMPFVGASGKELDRYLELAGLSRDQVFIANVVKCRPPSNRNPYTDEIAACAPFLREQLRSLHPQVIITLGNFASRFVLKTEVGITQLRGKAYDLGGMWVLPCFHPAAALYDRKKQAVLEEDFRYLGTLLEQDAHFGTSNKDEASPQT